MSSAQVDDDDRSHTSKDSGNTANPVDITEQALDHLFSTVGKMVPTKSNVKDLFKSFCQAPPRNSVQEKSPLTGSLMMKISVSSYLLRRKELILFKS